MRDSGKKFRRPLFGGFNRHDVIKYITNLADQRNKALQACAEAECNQQNLLDAIAELHKRNVDICREVTESKALKFSVLETAAETFLQLERAVSKLHKEIDKACGKTPADLISAAHSVGQILPMIKESRLMLDAIHESFKDELDDDEDESSAESEKPYTKKRKRRRKKNNAAASPQIQD